MPALRQSEQIDVPKPPCKSEQSDNPSLAVDGSPIILSDRDRDLLFAAIEAAPSVEPNAAWRRAAELHKQLTG